MIRDFLMKAIVSLFTVAALCSCNKDENDNKKEDAGTTGAIIANGNILTATAVGSVVVTATIAGGATRTAPFTADFNIAIKTAEEMPVVSLIKIRLSLI
jgi:hypothetical protein